MDDIKIKSIRNHQNVNLAEENSPPEKPYKPKRLKKFFRFIFLTLFIFIIGGIAGIFAERIFLPYLATIPFFNKYEFVKKAVEQTVIINKTEEINISEDLALVEAIKKIKPALVKIDIFYLTQSTKGKIKTKKLEPRLAESTTGSILTSDGLIITRPSFYSAEEILGKNSLKGISYRITLPDGREFQISDENVIKYSFQVSTRDPKSKLIILKIKATNLPVVSLADSDLLELGQRVGIVGEKITTGIISDFKTGTYRDTSIPKEMSKSQNWNLININTPLDENFSGAPVINLKGEIIGINAIEKKGKEFKSLVIPINDIKSFIDWEIKKQQ